MLMKKGYDDINLSFEGQIEELQNFKKHRH